MKRVFPALLLSTCTLFTVPTAYADNAVWRQWFVSQIRQHPSVQAARQDWLSGKSQADALDKPVYNPEFASEYEKIGDEKTIQLGIEQTIDWWDQSDSRQNQADALRQLTQSSYRQALLQQTAAALSALVEWESASQVALLAREQKEQLDKLLLIIDKRQKAGDLGQIDLELTVLAQAKRLAELAEAEANLARAEAEVEALLPDWRPDQGGVPEDFWQVKPERVSAEALQTHPAVIAARASWLVAKEDAEIVRKSLKAAPTIGINAGREGEQNLLNLSFSLPLNVRNDFSAETLAASQQAMGEEARFRASLREHIYRYESAYNSWQRFAQHWQRWQQLAQTRVESSKSLLEKQWASGDLSTADYLIALNERAEALVAGIGLREQTRMALINVLNLSGALEKLVKIEQ